ncbi:pilus assembly protein Flp/PilA [Cytobacillus oceanisediminis]|uniref:Pilus assembly protein Flp/PilA n=1 Tax=Cytobacillus oceanisediminis TaxID=665099 RepID=A0A2V2ZRT1_9BACI|nr:Flp family type IVb pilin [Cytobacillus oceanisediminis]PWW27049.1 pilus assembly protein Flp/PilA [Cytobacillus oceanisediminis]
MLNKIKGLFMEEEGQGMTEYGLILGLIAIVAIVGLGFLGKEVDAMFTKVKGALSGGSSTTTTTP